LRSEAVGRLNLKPGDRVFDAGCGNGGSFPFLLERVGPTGEVVGIEVSTEMASRARAHIRENGWHNVSVIEAPAQSAPLEGYFDALLLFAAHEILTSSVALDNLFAHLKSQGCVAAFGAKLTAPPIGWLTNPFFRMISKRWLPISPPIDTQPWRLLEGRLVQLRVEPRIGGVMYLVSGKKVD
jgi:ubiquinone/menaquinone biosynthesis C-methylase UbiE